MRVYLCTLLLMFCVSLLGAEEIEIIDSNDKLLPISATMSGYDHIKLFYATVSSGDSYTVQVAREGEYHSALIYVLPLENYEREVVEQLRNAIEAHRSRFIKPCD